MREQKPYEEGSTSRDVPKHGTMAELAQDRKSWQATKHDVDSSNQCSKPPQSQTRRARAAQLGAQAARIQVGSHGPITTLTKGRSLPKVIKSN